MRTRTSLLMLIVMTTLLSSLGSLVAVAATTGTAHACSIEGELLQVTPRTNLRPGQQVQVSGTGFYDLIPHPPTPPGEPRAMCDFDLLPMSELKVVWSGATEQSLAVVSGPRFDVTVQVPPTASPGEAWISVGNQNVPVSVNHPEILPPNPCPLVLGPDGVVSHVCPEPEPQPQPEPEPQPWPCPFMDATSSAPESLPPCPEPCVDYLHTTSDGTTYDYKWDCPDPCGYPQANPGAPTATSPVWCPPSPDPCLVGGDAWVCPEPCPLAVAGDELLLDCPPLPGPCSVPVPQPGFPYPCPVPCDSLVAGDLNCPEPCPLYPYDPVAPQETFSSQAQPDIAPYCPQPCPQDALCPVPCNSFVEGDLACPEPCPVYLHDAEGSLAQPDFAPCPSPCGPDVKPDAVWCPPIKAGTGPVAVDPPTDAAGPVEADEPAIPVEANQDVPVDSADAEEAFSEPAAGSTTGQSEPSPAPVQEIAVAPAPAEPATAPVASERAAVEVNGEADRESTLVVPVPLPPSEPAVAVAPAVIASQPERPEAPTVELATQRVAQSAQALFAMLFG